MIIILCVKHVSDIDCQVTTAIDHLPITGHNPNPNPDHYSNFRVRDCRSLPYRFVLFYGTPRAAFKSLRSVEVSAACSRQRDDPAGRLQASEQHFNFE